MSWSRLAQCHAIPNTLLKRLFYKYGILVARHPLLFTILPLFIVTILGIGLIYKDDRNQTELNYLYAPTTSNYIEEQNRILAMWPMDPNHFTPFSVVNVTRTTQAILYVRGDTNGSKDMLNPLNIHEASAFNEHVVKNLVVDVDFPNRTGTTVGFQEICLKLNNACAFENEHLAAIQNLIKYNLLNLLTYPAAKIDQNSPSVFVAAGVGGTKVDENGVLKFVKAISLIYFIRHDPDYQSMTLKWERSYARYVEDFNQNSTNKLKVLYTTSTAVVEGMEENTKMIKPRVAITFGVIIAFVVICSFRLKYESDKMCPSVDVVTSRPLLAIAGVLSAAFAIVSAQGLLLFAGFDFCSVVETVFSAIGVDDMFIITACWGNTDRTKSVEERMALTLSDSAVSITITSLTNIASFAIGMTTPIRAVQIFCVHIAVAIAMDYVLQITFFAGFMAISGKWEAEGRNSICVCLKSEEEHVTKSADVVHKFVDSFYGPLLTRPVTQVATVLAFMVYLGVGIWGAMHLDQSLKTDRLMLPGHHAAQFHKFRNQYFIPEGLQVEIMVQNVPDLESPTNRDIMEQIVTSFEGLEYTMDKQATQFWMRDYLGSFTRPRDNSRDWTIELFKWTHSKKIEKTYLQALQWKNASVSQINDGCDCEQTGVVTAFRFKIAFRNFGSTYNQKLAVTSLREIAGQFPEYQVTTYMGEYPYLDQYLIILPVTIKNIALAILWMGIIAFTLIPNPLCILWIVVTIVSIDVGIIGYMTLWGVSLDGVSMITIVMSIGFSVDFSAHITYGFTSAEGSSRERLAQAVKHMGLPVLQGGLSTLVGISVLSTVDTFMIQTFFKSVFLVILFGMTHACVFLPVMLVISNDFILYCRSKWASQSGRGDVTKSYDYHLTDAN